MIIAVHGWLLVALQESRTIGAATGELRQRPPGEEQSRQPPGKGKEPPQQHVQEQVRFGMQHSGTLPCGFRHAHKQRAAMCLATLWQMQSAGFSASQPSCSHFHTFLG